MGTVHEGFLVFVDESGDHGLQTIDPSYPVFVLVFCIIQKAHYARYLLPALTEFKFRHFGHDQVVLHEREIRKDTGEFAFLRDKEKKQDFCSELNELMRDLDLTVIATAIRKQDLVASYRAPRGPYEMALGFGLERIHLWLSRRARCRESTPVILECRGAREDGELAGEFRRICDGANYDRSPLRFEPRFVPKSANVPGLQIADLIARPIGRHVLDPSQSNRAFEVIEPKLDRSPTGQVRGWGLKVFP